MAHQSGQIPSCQKVSTKVKKEMIAHLKGSQKIDKRSERRNWKSRLSPIVMSTRDSSNLAKTDREMAYAQ